MTIHPLKGLAVIPVAGMGTRLLPATKSQPKEMLPVGRKPVVQYVVEELAKVGLNRLLFITGPGKTSIENHFDLNSELVQVLRETGKEDLLAELEFEQQPIQYFFTRQRQLLGLGHAVLCAQHFIGDQPFVVALGDSIISVKRGNSLNQSDIIQRMIACFTGNCFTDTSFKGNRPVDAVIAFEEVSPAETARYGIAKPDRNDSDVFKVVDVVEKPVPGDAPSNLAIAARYIFAPSIFHALQRTRPGVGGEIQLTDAVRILLKEGGTVLGVRLGPDETRFDIGNFDSYFQAFVDFALADPKHGPSLRKYLMDSLIEGSFPEGTFSEGSLHADHP